MVKQITDNASKSPVAAADILLVRDVSSNTDKKSTVSGLAPAIEASLSSDGAWKSWTPTWGNLTSGTNTVGNGNLEGRYQQYGKTIVFSIVLVWGSTTASTGIDWKFLPPVPPSANQVTHKMPIGTCLVEDAGIYLFDGFVRIFDSSSIQPTVIDASTSTGTRRAINPTSPMVWGPGDSMKLSGTYEAA